MYQVFKTQCLSIELVQDVQDILINKSSALLPDTAVTLLPESQANKYGELDLFIIA